jgi:hypothetical protein
MTHDLEDIAQILFQWFDNNGMKANPEKSHFIQSKDEELKIQIGNEVISNSKQVNLLGINIDHRLTFKEHVELLCNKASQKVSALARIAY